MKRYCFLFAMIIATVAGIIAGCGDDADESACVKGELQECPCGGGLPNGIQECLPDRSGWDRCDCDIAVSDSDSDADTDSDTDSDSDSDTDTDTDTDADTDTSCKSTNSCATYGCYSDDVYCYDNCGNRQNIYEYCDYGCSGSSCGSCYSINDCETRECYNNDVYCYDNCGERTVMDESCVYGCSNGQCQACSETDDCVYQRCYDGDLYCYNNCFEIKLSQRCEAGCDVDFNKCIDFDFGEYCANGRVPKQGVNAFGIVCSCLKLCSSTTACSFGESCCDELNAIPGDGGHYQASLCLDDDCGSWSMDNNPSCKVAWPD